MAYYEVVHVVDPNDDEPITVIFNYRAARVSVFAGTLTTDAVLSAVDDEPRLDADVHDIVYSRDDYGRAVVAALKARPGKYIDL